MTNLPVELVVTDLDGTLWDGTWRCHPDTLSALAEIAASGITVIAATARRPASALASMLDNDILLPAVLFDGSLGRDFTNETTFHRRVFDPGPATTVLEACLSEGLEPCLNIDDPTHDFVIGTNPATHEGHLAFNSTRTRWADLAEAVTTAPIFSFLLAGQDEHDLVPIMEALQGVAEGSIARDLTYGGHCLSVRPAGVSKWSGTVAFCQARGIDPARVLAVGDGENDVELLAEASIAVVPENGSPAALQLATHRIPPPHDGGWARILDLIA